MNDSQNTRRDIINTSSAFTITPLLLHFKLFLPLRLSSLFICSVFTVFCPPPGPPAYPPPLKPVRAQSSSILVTSHPSSRFTLPCSSLLLAASSALFSWTRLPQLDCCLAFRSCASSSFPFPIATVPVSFLRLLAGSLSSSLYRLVLFFHSFSVWFVWASSGVRLNLTSLQYKS